MDDSQLTHKLALQEPASQLGENRVALSPPSRPCRLEVYHSFESAAAIREDWTRLAEAVDADLFGSFEWCATWWRHFSQGRRLEIYTFWSGDELVAVFPLFRETLRWGPIGLRVLRLLGSDHAGTRCWPMFKTEFVEEVVPLLIAAMSRAGAWDILQIGDLPGYFQQTEVLCAALHEASAGRIHLNQSYYPHAVFTLPEHFEKYLEQLSGNERNNIRKSERKLSKTHVLKSTVVQPGDSRAFLDEFFHWHDDYWETQNDLGFFSLWPGSREFHSEIAQVQCDAGQSVLIRVHANDEPVGLICAHRFNGRLHLFQAVRAPGSSLESYGPGRLLHCEAFRWCMSQGISTVDAMSGFYEYKRRLGADFLGLTTLAMVHPSVSSRGRTKLFKAMVAIVDATYFRMWLCRITPLLRKRFRMKNHPLLRAGMARRFIRSRFILAAMRDSSDEPGSKHVGPQDG